MCNYITINFVRNDGNPSLTMMATLTETVCVVLIDWFFIFKLGLQMEGAALAVIFSPLCSLLVLSRHARFKHRQLTWRWVKPQLATLKTAARLGLAPFMNEMSSGVSIYVFNWMLLLLAGNYAVAAYGVVANVAIITFAAANGGCARGPTDCQPRIWQARAAKCRYGVLAWLEADGHVSGALNARFNCF